MAASHLSQITSLCLNTGSPKLDGIDCTSDMKHRISPPKTKASQLLDQGCPHTTSAFLKWRLAVVESELRVKDAEKKAVSEATTFFQESSTSRVEVTADLRKDEKALLREKIFLMGERKVLEEDLNDIVASKVQLTDAYITELALSLESVSTSKNKLAGMKFARLDRRAFHDAVHAYLDTQSKNLTRKTW